MAWISVHEQVIGGKLRTLAKRIGCSQNEALGMLVSLWLWGINNADVSGRITGASREDVAKIINIGIDDRLNAVDAVDALIDTGWIDLDSDLFLHDWQEWQAQWYKALKVRERDAERKRKERTEKKAESASDPSGRKEKRMEKDKSIPPLTLPPIDSQKSQMEPYTKEFENWWNTYPRKIGKGDAYKKYKARLNDGWTPEELLEAAVNYRKRTIGDRTDPKYIKHPKTFLSDTTPFTDFINKKNEKAQGNNDDNPYEEWGG